MRRTSTLKTPSNGITWYYEQEGTGPNHIVLIPDGVGDCALFSKPMALIAAGDPSFTVTTFDMPGLSRSQPSPEETYTNVTAQKLASYILSLLDELGIEEAVLWGSSSGGATVLALAIEHPERVRGGLCHEVPTYDLPELSGLLAIPDDNMIAGILAKGMCNASVGNKAAWDALGPEVHGRLYKNYARWARGYPMSIPGSAPVKNMMELARCSERLDWSVGKDTKMGLFVDNVITATKAGVRLEVLAGMHVPYVSHSDEWAEYVAKKATGYFQG